MADTGQRRRTKTRKKRELKWLAYYCKVSAFEARGDEKGPTLELDLELLEAVPKVTSLAVTVYGERPEYQIEERWIPEQGRERRVVASSRCIGLGGGEH